MSSLIFVRDASGRPLMPMAPAHARKLLSQGKARRVPHHAFTIVQLETHVWRPSLSPVVLGIQHNYFQSHFWVLSHPKSSYLPLMYFQTSLLPPPNLPWLTERNINKHDNAAQQSLSLQVATTAVNTLHTLLPISTIYIFSSKQHWHQHARLMHATRQTSRAQVERLLLAQSTQASSMHRQLQAFVQQPSIAHGAFVMIPTSPSLKDYFRYLPKGRAMKSNGFAVGSSDNGLYAIEPSTLSTWLPYWETFQSIQWNQISIPSELIYPLHFNEACTFIPIRVQSNRPAIQENLHNAEQ
ncbi:MAG: RRXRR domain-containing protein [Herpetosiphonaceae bacterium]|nr:RRXRR domain-containing protein [Herpetosiphonaceae bacterium]